ncbi:MAG: 2-dehydro-3-deoxy-D-gluconate 5-dehydrogenase KduD [Spirochaetaceae bacterium]|jgi:2-deoxy-D-gluconate 3-dehydrogenase|nr:2-dehydro-3-deoxy-D-gluconate 5-dehydrogenase KduD [Spirochaetaceae bacterium]
MNLDKFSLEGKTAIVTGCSTGLGQGMCFGLAEAGADVVGIDYVDAPETQAGVEKLGQQYLGIKANLLSIDPIEGIVDQVVKKFGKVDILINNAGIIRREDSINFSEKDWDDVMNINIKTVFFFCQAVAKRFIAQKTGGKIVNIASMLSFQGGIRVPSYTASKSAVMGITKLMACEWAKENINVNAIAPGYMNTNNTEALRADKERSREILNRIPADRWGLPKDVAGPAVFLCSSASDYINGYTVAVDGGWLAR